MPELIEKMIGMVSRVATISPAMKLMPKKVEGTRAADDEAAPGEAIESLAEESAEGDDLTKRAFPVTLATEDPSIVVDWSRWEVIREILLMNGADLPGNRQVVMLDSHVRNGGVANAVKGSFRNLRTEGASLNADAYFSSAAMREAQLVNEGHLTDVSVGYRTYPETTTILKTGESGVVGGRTFTNNYQDGLDLYIRSTWTPNEGSLAPIGADKQSKFREDELEKLINQVRALETTNNLNKTKEGIKMPEKNERTAEVILADERKRVSEIEKYAEQFKGRFKDDVNVTRKAVQEGMSADQFRMLVLDTLTERSAVAGAGSTVGMDDRQKRDYSIRKAIAAHMDNTFFRENSLEREAHESMVKIAEESGWKSHGERSFLIPGDVSFKLGNGQRDYTSPTGTTLATNTTANGGGLVPTNYLGGQFIDYLRNLIVLMKLGVTSLTGLRGNIVIPKQLTTTTFSMVGYGAASETEMTVGQVTATPHFGSATTSYHRSLLLQADPSIDSLVFNDLFAVAGIGIDYYGVYGAGTGNEPKGLLAQTGIGSVDCSDGLSYAKLVEFTKKLKKANATQLGDIKFAMSPDVEAVALTTPKSGNYPIFLINEEGGKIGTRAYESSNQIGSQALIAGIWSELVLCDWNLYEVLVNPYGANSKSGNIDVTIFSAFDWIVKRAAAFAASTNVLLPA